MDPLCWAGAGIRSGMRGALVAVNVDTGIGLVQIGAWWGSALPMAPPIVCSVGQ